MTLQNSQNQKQGILQNKSTETALTPLEIASLRKDLKQAHKQSRGYFKHRAEKLAGRLVHEKSEAV